MYIPAYDQKSRTQNVVSGEVNVGLLGRMYNVSGAGNQTLQAAGADSWGIANLLDPAHGQDEVSADSLPPEV